MWAIDAAAVEAQAYDREVVPALGTSLRVDRLSPKQPGSSSVVTVAPAVHLHCLSGHGR